MEKINTVIFDLDGTLLDTLEDLKDSLNHTFKKFGLPERSLDDTRRFVGNGIRTLICRAVPEGTSEEMIDTLFEEMKAYYDLHCLDKTKPYDGVVTLLSQFYEAGYKLAIVSNKVDSAVKDLNKTFFSDYVSVAIGEKPGIERKPAPDTVIEALRQLGSTKEEAIYIGDSEVDVATAKNSGMPCVSVLWGFRSKEWLLERGGSVFAETADEVFRYVTELNEEF